MTGPANPPAGGMIGSLTGLRAFLSWLVLLVHMAPLAIALEPLSTPFWIALWHHCDVALDVFFLLSGFVITAGYRKVFGSWPRPGVYARFLWARLARFYPVHLAVLAALVLAVVVGPMVGMTVPHGGDLQGDLLRNLLLLQGWGDARTLTWNGPSWTVSSEWFCYLIAPVVLIVVVRTRSATRLIALYLLAVAVVLCAYAVLGFDDAHTTYLAPLWRAVGGFVAGSALFQLTRTDSRLPGFCGRHTEALVGLLLAVVVVLGLRGLPSMLGEPLIGLVLLGLAARRRGSVERALSTRPMVWAGEISVALYLTHVPWLMLAGRWVTPERFPGVWGYAALVGLVVGAFAVAFGTYHLVERPAQKLMKRLAPRPTVPRPDRALAWGSVPTAAVAATSAPMEPERPAASAT